MNRIHYLKIVYFLKAFIFSFLLFLNSLIFASDNSNKSHGNKNDTISREHSEDWPLKVEEEEYNAGKQIIEHIVDSYDWHIMDIGGHAVSIHLPVILWYNGRLSIFCSGKFEHGNVSYKGFKIANEGPNNGKIIKILEEDFVHGDVIEEGANEDLPLDFSITKNVFSIFISIIIICWIFISIAKTYKKRKGKAPKGLQSLLEPIILFIRDDVAKLAIGEKEYEKFMPYLLTLFFFIFLNNLLGLVPFFPGGANVTGNIAVTGVLAFFTLIITFFSGNKNYWTHIINNPGIPWWLKFPVPLMPIIELIGIITKPFVLMVRLFANITAGHIIVLGFVSLIFIFGNINIAMGYGVSIVSVLFAIFMGLLELLVALIQAYVFTLLSALYFGMATEEHH